MYVFSAGNHTCKAHARTRKSVQVTRLYIFSFGLFTACMLGDAKRDAFFLLEIRARSTHIN